MSFSAAKKAREPQTNGVGVNYTRSSTRGITQVPEQISSPADDHEMEDDDDDLDQRDDENHHHHHRHHSRPESPTDTNISDDAIDRSHRIHDDDHLLTLNHQRKRVVPSNHTRSLIEPSNYSGKSNLLAVRTHLEKGKNTFQSK